MPAINSKTNERAPREELIRQIDDAKNIGTLLGVHAVAFYLGQSPDWVYDRGETGDFPVIRLGRKVAYRISDIEAWLDERSRSTGDVAVARHPRSDDGPTSQQTRESTDGRGRA